MLVHTNLRAAQPKNPQQKQAFLWQDFKLFICCFFEQLDLNNCFSLNFISYLSLGDKRACFTCGTKWVQIKAHNLLGFVLLMFYRPVAFA
jgi:hypothetical protein